MLSFTEYIKELEQYEDMGDPNCLIISNTLDTEKGVDIEEAYSDMINESQGITPTVAIKMQNDVIGYGRKVIRARTVEDKLDYLARQNASLAGLVIMSIGVSGKKSFLNTLSKGLSLRKL
tara:strand:+ start:275 stop:634 length:360 start_codon:yes stop_codon:yes gene_type:complete